MRASAGSCTGGLTAAVMPHLFALDQNFPEPIVAALQRYLKDDVELVPGAPVLCPA